MLSEMEKEATKMVNGEVESKSRKGLPDFLGSVNLRYVKLGYIYLLSFSNTFCFFLPPILLLVIFVSQFLPLLAFPLSIFFLLLFYHFLTPCSVFLLDFSCYRPPDHLKVVSLPSPPFFFSYSSSHCCFCGCTLYRSQKVTSSSWQ